MIKIYRSNRQQIIGLSSEQLSLLKNVLTFDNPAYKAAKRYSGRKYISIPPYLTYYTEITKRNKDFSTTKILEVPIGVDVENILNTNCEVYDKRTSHKVDYPEFCLTLRPDQDKAKLAYLNEFGCEEDQKSSYVERSIIQLPTGKGKTILALNIAYTLKQKTLVLVHKDDLVAGWQNDIKDCFGGKLNSGLIKAKKRVIGEQITIATVQTLSRMDKDTLNQYVNEFGLVIQDECLVGNTLVCLEDGGVKTIDHIINSDKVIGGSVSNKFHRKSRIFELQSNNAIIKGSPTHPTWCVKKGKKHYSLEDFECKPIKDITGDYYIPILTTLPHTTKNELSVEEARFVAMIMCDGHLDSTSKRVKVNVNKDRKYYYDVMKSYADHIGAELKYSNDIRENITYWFTDDRVKDVLTTKWGVSTGKKSNILTIPSALYYCPLESIKAFIETCFNCEGDLSISDKGSVRINFNTVSEDFAQGICILLKKFGIVSNIQKIVRNEDNHNTLYRLSVGGVFYNKFAETFILLDRKSTNIRNHRTQYNRFVGEYYLSPVKCIKDLDYDDYVFDFTVSGEKHSFIANGVYTHNCHHVGLNIFNVIDSFSAEYKIGLSATPTRSDGLDYVFNLFFGGICYKHEYVAGDEDILPVEVIIKESKAKYDPFMYEERYFNLHDFKSDELPNPLQRVRDMPYRERPRIPFLVIDDSLVSNRRYKIQVCKDILKEYRAGHSCIAFFTQKEHIVSYYRYLKLFVPEETILLYYGDNKEKSDVLMRKAESRECLITLSTYAKATEGTNVKSWEVGFLVSSINNEKNTEQAVGRIRRSKEGKINPAILYDYRFKGSYSVSNHGRTRDRVYRKLKFKITDLTSSVTSKKKGLFSRGYT